MLDKHQEFMESEARKWVGDLPEGWRLVRNQGLFDESKIVGHSDEELLSVTIEHGIIPQSEVAIKKDSSNEDKSKYKLLEPGDLAYNKMRMWQGAIGRSEHRGIVSPAYVALRPRDSDYSRYFHYVYRTHRFITEANRNSYGLCDDMNSLRYEHFKTIRTPVPPKDTMNRIVAFLDEKTAEIDAAVGKKRRLIDLLNEQKAILINRAVTKGLNPTAPMKDSGVDWIGEIPAHWDVMRNAALFEQTKKSGTADLPVLSVSIHHGVSREELSEEENLRSAIKIADRTSYVEVLPGYIAYNMMRAWQGGIGAVHTHGMVSPAYVVARPFGKMDAEYFERLYRTKLFIDQMDQYSKGITDFRKRLYWEEFKVLLTLVPPVDEQIDIAAFCGTIDDACKDAVSATEREIAILNEFKQTLIANAVTGKIKI